MTDTTLNRLLIPGRAGTLLAELGDRAVCYDLYDKAGAPVYHDLAGQDTHEVRELLTLVRAVPGPVLDLAAGSGRLTMPLLASGRDVTALEISGSMLKLLDARLAGAPEALRNRCTTVQADMSDFALGRKFGVIVLGTTSVSLLDVPGRKGLYHSVHAHLAPGGRFLLSTVDLAAGGRAPAETEVEFTAASGRRYRMFEYWVPGAEARTVTVFPAVIGEAQVDVCTTSIRVLSADQLEEELRQSGFAVCSRSLLPDIGMRHHSVLIEAQVTA
ncbi:daptide-type RiPP biosynthesis methyltransferase [Streptomyces chrestomyceticus]|uniref:daptide-type RiPP biosynthesis methyltransferase n=1 Tax=Streptomyces chrestomyceticus TaxID=68185 RepID=UPI0004CB6ECD